MTAPLDLIVLTYNEEVNIDRCLRSVEGLVNRIFVVDSFSTDATVALARAQGATVVQHEFTTQADQFNWALENLPVESEWILRLDADEYLTDALRNELLTGLINFPEDITGLYAKRRMIFMGRWIRHGGYYPTWILRVFRKGKARSENADLNEHIVLLEGKSRQLENDFVDHDQQTLSEWVLKHERYAARLGRFIKRLEDQGYDPQWISQKLSGNQAERKRWLIDKLYRRTPMFFRSFLYFVYRYFLRLGFLDGTPGLIFHFLHGCWYMFYTDALLYEQKHRGRQCVELQAQ